MDIALVGNPNCGKTTLFNALTKSRQRIGNWSGVTVECKSGHYHYKNQTVTIIDLPGIYTLNGVSKDRALDEQVACEKILTGKIELIVNVLDATHLERSLYLTMQLVALEVPLILAVNMIDIAKRYQTRVNLQQLSQCLGCPVVGLEANKKLGLSELQQLIYSYKKNAYLPKTDFFAYPPLINHAINQLLPECKAYTPYAHWLAIHLLEFPVDSFLKLDDKLLEKAKSIHNHLRLQLNEDLDILLADIRYQHCNQIVKEVITKQSSRKKYWTERLDKLFLHRILGIPFFLLIMYSMFVFAINFGGAFQDFFEIAGDTIFIEGASHWMIQLGFSEWLIGLIAGGVGLGITTTLGFIPVIGAMFLFLSFLESTGYMARAAFVMDRVMQAVGLPGKSFVPMIVGFGCNVPSVMAARTLENRRDRILTIMMSPFMSCGARLAIYAVFVAAFFPQGGQNIIFILYLIGIMMALITGLLLRGTLLKGETSPLILELPVYHLPSPKELLVNTGYKLKNFLTKAGKIIIPLCVMIGFLNALTVEGQLNFNQTNKDSVLSLVGKTVSPIFQPLGIQQDNWPAAVGIVSGLLAKEVVVATLNTLYTQVDELLIEGEKEGFNFWQGIYQAVASLPVNLREFPVALSNPLAGNAPKEELSNLMYGQMYQRFDGQVGAFAYLLFLLLYFPCVSTTAVIKRELSWQWALFSVGWTTGIAYCVAVFFYQCATFTTHPISSLIWNFAIILGLILFVTWMRSYTYKRSVAKKGSILYELN